MESSYSHFILYAKGHYERADSIQDLKRLIWQRSGVEEQYVRLIDIVTVLLNAYEELRGGQPIPEYEFRTLLLDDLNPDSIKNSFDGESKDYPGLLISALLGKICCSRVKNDDGEPIVILAPANPSILPLRKMEDDDNED